MMKGLSATALLIMLALISYIIIISIVLKIFRHNRQDNEMVNKRTDKDFSFEDHDQK
ncbi:MAG TPA: hypothetical protein VFW07_08465 [Parafilimonas sp.]|nr:hypothetical protein [Parafilimonas sp.]